MPPKAAPRCGRCPPCLNLQWKKRCMSQSLAPAAPGEEPPAASAPGETGLAKFFAKKRIREFVESPRKHQVEEAKKEKPVVLDDDEDSAPVASLGKKDCGYFHVFQVFAVVVPCFALPSEGSAARGIALAPLPPMCTRQEDVAGRVEKHDRSAPGEPAGSAQGGSQPAEPVEADTAGQEDDVEYLGQFLVEGRQVDDKAARSAKSILTDSGSAAPSGTHCPDPGSRGHCEVGGARGSGRARARPGRECGTQAEKLQKYLAEAISTSATSPTPPAASPPAEAPPVLGQLQAAVQSGSLDPRGPLGNLFYRTLSNQEKKQYQEIRTFQAKQNFRLQWAEKRLKIEQDRLVFFVLSNSAVLFLLKMLFFSVRNLFGPSLAYCIVFDSFVAHRFRKSS